VLKVVSRFVLEVLPYALSALIVAIIVPGFLSAHFHATQPVRAVDGGVGSNVGALELVRGYRLRPQARRLATSAP
jgi:hypothetical protein